MQAIKQQGQQSKINPQGLRNLARAVLDQAGRDARGSGPEAAEARAWLVLGSGPWLEALEITLQPGAMRADIANLPPVRLSPYQALFSAMVYREVSEWKIK